MCRGAVAAVCSVLTALALSGCSSDPGAEDPATAEQLPPLGPAVTVSPGAASPNGQGAAFTDPAALRAALLDVTDLPAGFARLADPEMDLGLPPASESSDTDNSSTTPTECEAVLAEIADQQPGVLASAANWFSGPNFASVDQDAAGYPTPADAARAFAGVQDTLSRCTEFSGTDADGVPVSYRVGGREQARTGDGSVAFRLVTTSEGLSLVSDVVIAIVGSTVTQLVASAQEPIDPGVLEDLTRTAVARLAPSVAR